MQRTHTEPRTRTGAAILGVTLLAAAAGCEQPRAAGDAHAIIVATSEEAWERIEEPLARVLQPTILTVREERTFRLTQQEPAGPDWSRLQRLRQVLVVGSEEEPWVREALAEAGDRRPLDPPEIIQVNNVWARGQVVTILLSDPGREDEAVRALGGQLHELLDGQFREYVLNRMFVSGRDTALADSLRRNVGFSVELPNVYRHSVRDSVFRFRNDNPSPAELIREIAVTWTSPLPEEFDEEDLLEWRRSLAEDYYADGQLLNTDRSEVEHVPVDGKEALQLRASWESPADAWPAAGPFVSRAVPCPEDDRLYLLDAWLYAPGRDKYEFMIQLETILDSFRCVPTSERAGSSG